MTRARKVVLAAAITLTLVAAVPVLGFELAWRWWFREVGPISVAASSAPERAQNALWVAFGETPGAGIDAIWLGTWLQALKKVNARSSGQNATAHVTKAIVLQGNTHLGHSAFTMRWVALQVWASRHLTESELKALLSDRTYFGRDAHGLENASRAFFDKPLAELGTNELALLVGLAKGPQRYEPGRHPDRADARRRDILRRFRDTGLIDERELATLEPERVPVVNWRAPATGPPPQAD